MQARNKDPLTESQLDDAAADLRAWLAAYMLTPAFEIRAIAACAEVEAGGLTDAESLAHALGLPVEFLGIALEKHVAKYVAEMGGIN
jgi:hypothetical protein